MAHQRGLLDLRPHHHARRVAQEQDGQVEGVAQLQETRGLVRAIGIDRPGEVSRIVGDDAQRLTFDAGQRRHHAWPEGAAQFQHRAFVAKGVDDIAHVVDAQAILRDGAAQQALVGGAPFGQRTLEIGQIFLGDRNRLGLVLDGDIDRSVGHLHAHRAYFLGREHAEIAALDHRRPAHADRRVLGRDHHVAAAEQRGIAGEAAARIDADQR